MASYEETLRDTILQNRKGAVFRTEYKQLLQEFKHANQRIYFPQPIYDACIQRINPIKKQQDRLFSEIHGHKTETKPAMWTETYFKTEVQLLSHWTSLMIRQHQELADAGMDTTDALNAYNAFYAKVTDVITKWTADAIVASVMRALYE
jgi:hypothetical protein